MASDMLNSMGFKVKTAKNGFDGIKIYEKYGERIDLVLLDLIMPGMDGVTCFKKILEINPKVKVIVSSGIGEQEKKNQLIKMGIVGYLEKPYSMKGIAKKIEDVL